eukprot:GILK01011973.1.p1 GENE.GILK01011973.1~~GILK01011973.1.p1  ORF type:complete len:127 (-),score=13.88 GILK01011973.1:458-838(-)
MISGYDFSGGRATESIEFSVCFEEKPSTVCLSDSSYASEILVGFSEHKESSWCTSDHGFFLGGNQRHEDLQFTTGDVIKCCFRVPSREVSFYLNGSLMATHQAHTSFLFPCVRVLGGHVRLIDHHE